MSPDTNRKGKQQAKVKELGTAAVFLTATSTILGAIMFLRFGYSVAHAGLLGTLAIILLGHIVTIPTAMAVAEIATNQKVEGGGAYHIISRSFGVTIGAAIGIALYLSQAISVAFYTIAFAEAFRPVYAFLNATYGYALADPRIVSVPAVFLLAGLVLTKGANLGIKTLYLVVGTLFISLALFFAGGTGYSPAGLPNLWTARVDSPDPFFLVFAIIFPAFTGIAAGLGLSGDLKNPKRAIPLGTLMATAVGMVIYVLLALKLAMSASPRDLAADQLIMSRIALWGPIIPIGLGCATFSSALGSIMVAPRTLQALGLDGVFPGEIFNRWVARGRGKTDEPFNGSLLTLAISLCFVVVGDVNFVARIISMVFMVTYGAICFISFLEHFAADPSYRPSFRSKWYISLVGAVVCLWFMFEMSPLYAAVSILLMAVIYILVARYHPEKKGLANIFQGAIFQISRKLHVFLQKTKVTSEAAWRPSVVCISKDSFSRLAAFDLLRWISHRYGFGTYIHFIEGYFSRSSKDEAAQVLQRLVRLAGVSESNVYVDTMISPSYTTAIAQLVQLPSISGKENNLVLFEFSKDHMEDVDRIVNNYGLATAADFDVCILASSERGFGYHREIHIWISPADYENANLMILLGYIILGHPDWHGGFIRIFALFPEKDLEKEREDLLTLVREGRLSVSRRNIETIPLGQDASRQLLVSQHSRDADLVIVGFRGELLKREKSDLFSGYDEVGSILFVNTKREIEIERVLEEEPPPEEGAGEEETADREGAADNGSRELEEGDRKKTPGTDPSEGPEDAPGS
ncbi:MAG: amino acid permease [bacterium]|nr:MAG: amino acid permease [bacterium]